MKDELVMCAEAARLSLAASDVGFTPVPPADIERSLKTAGIWFGPRQHLEEDDRFVQLIPYVVMRSGPCIVVYRRGALSGEARLRGRRSVGFGGHVSVEDIVTTSGGIDPMATLGRAAAREVAEEVRLGHVESRETIGILRDTSTAVSRVHVGIVQMWTVTAESVAPAEQAITKCELLDLSRIGADGEEFETWSQLTLRHLQARE